MFTSASLLTGDSAANETVNEKAARQHSAVNGDLIFTGAMGPSEPSMHYNFIQFPYTFSICQSMRKRLGEV
jgi:hypothetical protein